MSAANPYAGLKPFGEEDAEWLFGRSAEINDLMKRLRRLHFLAVVGASGSGKSSLVRAGVLPHVRDGYLDADWLIATMRPGDRPLANLAEALGPLLPTRSPAMISEALNSGAGGLARLFEAADLPPGTRLLLLVDQFEELFGFAARAGDAASEEVKAFLKLLLAAANSDGFPVYVLITMRLEWLNECASYVGWAEAMNEGLYLVPSMSRQQFQRVILGPLELAGGSITSSLVGRMLNDLDGRSDQLPVLQHALMRLWDRCGANTPFDNANYEAVGTVARCLSAHAEEVYAELTDPQKRAAEGIFKSITQVNKNRRVRRPRPLREILSSRGLSFGEAEAVITAFSLPGRSFLVTTQGALNEDSVIDLSHEALIRQWERLCKWVDAEADTEARLYRLHEDATEWDSDRKGRADCLYRGTGLQRAEELLPLVPSAGPEAQFLRACARARTWQRLRTLGVVALLLCMVAAFGLYQLHVTRKTHLMEVNALKERQRSAENDAALAQRLSNYQNTLLQQIGQAHGSASELASIARSIQATRVYVQYTPATAGAAQAAQTQLQAGGYTVPPLQQVNPDRAPTQSQVRFFHPEDRDGAAKIASLLHLPGTGRLAAQSQSNPNGVVPPGQFELWLVPSSNAPYKTPPPLNVSGGAPPPIGTIPAQVAAPAAAPGPPPVLIAAASPNQVLAGALVHLVWQSFNTSTVSIASSARNSPSMAGLPATDSIVVTPDQTTDYTFTATGPSGTATRTVLVTVVQPPAPPSAPVAAAASPAPVVQAAAAGPLAIRNALTAYREAYQSESLSDVKRAWPTVSKAQQNSLKLVFNQFNAIRLNLNCAENDIHVEGDTASATCEQSATYTEHGRKLPVQTSKTTFRLRKQGESWVIDSVQ